MIDSTTTNGSSQPRHHTPVSELLKNAGLFEARGFVAGKWRTASNNATFPVYEPATGLVLGECANFSKDAFANSIDTCHDGYQEFWSQFTAKERAKILRRWNDSILENVDDLATILSLENGKAISEARGEIAYAASFVQWFSEECTRSYGDNIPSSYPSSMVFTSKEPVGVCGIITPWNFPAAMITRKIAPAFAAGCSVVIKPPSETPFTAAALTKLALAAGVPDNVIALVPTKDREASLELAINPKVKKISFTGSTAVGKMLTSLASGTMKKVSMELGGNAPFVVFEDADLDIAVDAALVCKFRSSGQTCVCANRLLVHESVVDAFSERLVAKVKKMQLGKGINANTTHGPLVNAAAVDKVERHVQDALKKGGQLRIGGRRPEGLTGYFYEPTVITGATKDMEVAKDETFGPLAPIFEFSTEQEALDLANDTEFGLAGYFFTKDISRVLRVAGALQVGMIGVNTGLISAAETPFGGINESGVGREGSKYGLAEYQNIKAVTIGAIKA
ncbi:aldehyde dehydrogenase [Aaosphaeria arxii CBS 175.79]|uniref:Succinate-semialdehyde dehydrogenase, mitochondrial n=1 Tax=Aaosphaeria arxii CBS 175.79 TaxID=1450172 RepID=A0A6A5Y8U1_9PLEO|nr:aldehyde dehydrogenase [Aaosphaeria arxii CBS 175.79]KAF2021161.1 aldehyde dehydrogenase [Aaosphaeria arxii CBS 175.79]